MSNQHETIAAYGRAWQESDADERRALLRTIFGDSGRYTDPTTEITGAEALSRHIGAFQSDNPGARIDITSTATMHHDVAHFTWHMACRMDPRASAGTISFYSTRQAEYAIWRAFFGDPKPL